MVALDEATELEGGDGTYAIALSEEWEIWGPSGGYLAALTLRAAGMHAGIPRPVSYYCHFISPPAFDRVELAVEVVKAGRRSESLAVRMTQGGGEVMFALVRTAAEAPGYRHQVVEAPESGRPRTRSRSSAGPRTAVSSTPSGTTSAAAARRSRPATRSRGSASGSASSRGPHSRTPSSMPPGR